MGVGQGQSDEKADKAGVRAKEEEGGEARWVRVANTNPGALEGLPQAGVRKSTDPN